MVSLSLCRHACTGPAFFVFYQVCTSHHVLNTSEINTVCTERRPYWNAKTWKKKCVCRELDCHMVHTSGHRADRDLISSSFKSCRYFLVQQVHKKLRVNRLFWFSQTKKRFGCFFKYETQTKREMSRAAAPSSSVRGVLNDNQEIVLICEETGKIVK